MAKIKNPSNVRYAVSSIEKTTYHRTLAAAKKEAIKRSKDPYDGEVSVTELKTGITVWHPYGAKNSNPGTNSNSEDWIPCHAIRKTASGDIELLLTEKGVMSNPSKKKKLMKFVRKIGKVISNPSYRIKSEDVPGVKWKKWYIMRGKDKISGPYYSLQSAKEALAKFGPRKF